MKVYFLYKDREWVNIKRYIDAENIIQDLGLKTLFSISGKEIIYKDGKVEGLQQENVFLSQTMKTVMMVPLTTETELKYRQAMVQDALRNEEFIGELYTYVEEVLRKWDALGRKVTGKGNARDSSGKLLYDIQVLKLFVTSLSEIKGMFCKEIERFSNGGFRAFYERLCEEFPEEKETAIKKILEDITFFTNDFEKDAQYRTEVSSKIVLGCDLSQGLKCSNFVVEDISTELKRIRLYSGVVGLMKEYKNAQNPGVIPSQKNPNVQEQATNLKKETVKYVISACAPFMDGLEDFWDQLHFQLGFFQAASILRRHIWRYNLPFSYPKVSEQDVLRFENLKEFIMAIEQKRSPIGNTCDISNRMLLVITGANQGGKSTFLRSIGIAQIMMQCGLPVIASNYESGLFPSFFTHFTRREDSAMNSGRLDEELNRMSQIVDNLGAHSMVLLNESFATTTEKEGSAIAYDIIKALTEAGVKVLTVTHLLSFAQKVYEEHVMMSDTMQNSCNAKVIGVEFLSAERGENGERTYRMVQHEPELTSFGMDLYESIIGGKKIPRI